MRRSALTVTAQEGIRTPALRQLVYGALPLSYPDSHIQAARLAVGRESYLFAILISFTAACNFGIASAVIWSTRSYP
jgi:hypothetical protein